MLRVLRSPGTCSPPGCAARMSRRRAGEDDQRSVARPRTSGVIQRGTGATYDCIENRSRRTVHDADALLRSTTDFGHRVLSREDSRSPRMRSSTPPRWREGRAASSIVVAPRSRSGCPPTPTPRFAAIRSIASDVWNDRRTDLLTPAGVTICPSPPVPQVEPSDDAQPIDASNANR